jgi:hypothetical protein
MYMAIAKYKEWSIELTVALECFLSGFGFPGGLSKIVSAFMPATLCRVVNAQGQLVQLPPNLSLEVDDGKIPFVAAGGIAIVFLLIASLISAYSGEKQMKLKRGKKSPRARKTRKAASAGRANRRRSRRHRRIARMIRRLARRTKVRGETEGGRRRAVPLSRVKRDQATVCRRAARKDCVALTPP